MSALRVSDTAALLRLLCGDGIEFIVVGMTAAVLQGVPATTQDLDVGHGLRSGWGEKPDDFSQSHERAAEEDFT